MFRRRTSRIAADNEMHRRSAYRLTSSNSLSVHRTVVRVVIGIRNLLPLLFSFGRRSVSEKTKNIFCVVFFVCAAELGRVGRMILNFYKIRESNRTLIYRKLCMTLPTLPETRSPTSRATSFGCFFRR